jgi:hypothetical protein
MCGKWQWNNIKENEISKNCKIKMCKVKSNTETATNHEPVIFHLECHTINPKLRTLQRIRKLINSDKVGKNFPLNCLRSSEYDSVCWSFYFRAVLYPNRF